jgi:hypothetical protein
MNKILNYEGCPECGNENLFMGVKNRCYYCGYIVISCGLCSNCNNGRCTPDCVKGSRFKIEKSNVLSLSYIGYKRNFKIINFKDIKL